MEGEWSRFGEAILEVTEELCGTKKIIDGMRRKESEWWSKKIKKLFKSKKGRFFV